MPDIALPESAAGPTDRIVAHGAGSMSRRTGRPHAPTWMLWRRPDAGVVRGNTVVIDPSTLEAMRRILRTVTPTTASVSRFPGCLASCGSGGCACRHRVWVLRMRSVAGGPLLFSFRLEAGPLARTGVGMPTPSRSRPETSHGSPQSPNGRMPTPATRRRCLRRAADPPEAAAAGHAGYLPTRHRSRRPAWSLGAMSPTWLPGGSPAKPTRCPRQGGCRPAAASRPPRPAATATARRTEPPNAHLYETGPLRRALRRRDAPTRAPRRDAPPPSGRANALVGSLIFALSPSRSRIRMSGRRFRPAARCIPDSPYNAIVINSFCSPSSGALPPPAAG